MFVSQEMKHEIEEASLEYWIEYNCDIAYGRRDGDEWLDEDGEEGRREDGYFDITDEYKQAELEFRVSEVKYWEFHKWLQTKKYRTRYLVRRGEELGRKFPQMTGWNVPEHIFDQNSPPSNNEGWWEFVDMKLYGAKSNLKFYITYYQQGWE